MSEEPSTRKELQEALEKERAEKSALESRLARLEAAFAASVETDAQRRQREARLADAEAELAALRPGAAQALERPRGPPPKFVPYRGLVRARVECAIGHHHLPGDVFSVDLPNLWSDDPFEPVKQVGTAEEPQYEVNEAVSVVDYRFRPRAADMGQLAANQI